MIFIMDYNEINTLVLSNFHQVFYRIYSILLFKGYNRPTNVIRNEMLDILYKLIKDKQNSFDDCYGINLIIHYLIVSHIFIENLPKLFSRLARIMNYLSKPQFLHSQLLIWRLINALLLDKSEFKFQLSRLKLLYENINIDIIFDEHVEESLTIIRILYEKQNKGSRIDLKYDWSQIIGLVMSANSLHQKTNILKHDLLYVDYDILNEMLMSIIFLTKLQGIKRLDEFLGILCFKTDPFSLFKYLNEEFYVDENLRRSWIILIGQLLPEKVLFNTSWSKYISLIDELSKNANSITDRLASIYCAEKLFECFLRNIMNESTEVQLKLLPNYIQLFPILLYLFQDNETIISDTTGQTINHLIQIFQSLTNEDLSEMDFFEPIKSYIAIFIFSIEKTIRMVILVLIVIKILEQSDGITQTNHSDEYRLFERTTNSSIVYDYCILKNVIRMIKYLLTRNKFSNPNDEFNSMVPVMLKQMLERILNKCKNKSNFVDNEIEANNLFSYYGRYKFKGILTNFNENLFLNDENEKIFQEIDLKLNNETIKLLDFFI